MNQGYRFVLQTTLRALENLPSQKLIQYHHRDENGDYCAFGAWGPTLGFEVYRAKYMSDNQRVESYAFSDACGDYIKQHINKKEYTAADQAVRDIIKVNNDFIGTPEARYKYMVQWLMDQLVSAKANADLSAVS